MIDKVVRITCDWCGDFQQTSRKGVGMKRFEKMALKEYGWKDMIVAGYGRRHFCCQECYELYKKDV